MNVGSHTYTAHNILEVSAMIPENVGNHDAFVRKREGGIHEFKHTNRAEDPLHFVLSYSKGTAGWRSDQIFEQDE